MLVIQLALAGLIIDNAYAQSPGMVRLTARNSDLGDFDADGLTDAVYGDAAAGSDSTCAAGYGAVVVHYGADPQTPVTLERGDELEGKQVCGAGLGGSVTVADVDGDGHDDLIIGAAGVAEIQVIHGGRKGLDRARQQTAPGDPSFGYALTSGDYDCDGFEDVAVGIPEDGHGGAKEAGSVAIFDGGRLGLVDSGQRLRQGGDLGDAPEDGDRLGHTLASGVFSADEAGTCECDQLVIAAPFEDVDGYSDAGVVYVFSDPPTGKPSHIIEPDKASVIPLARDQALGLRIGVGDDNADGIDDLSLAMVAEGAMALLEGDRGGLGQTRVLRDRSELDPSCTQAASSSDTIVMSPMLVLGDEDCAPCCGPGSCCIGGSCE